MATTDVNVTSLTQETYSTLDGSEQVIMFDSAEGKRATVAAVGEYVLKKLTTSLNGSTQTVAAALSSLNSDVNDKSNETATGNYGLKCSARKTGNLVFLRVSGSITAELPLKTWTTIATLSEAYRPITIVPPNTFFLQNTGDIVDIQVLTTGEVQIYAANKAISSGSVNIVTVYSLIN